VTTTRRLSGGARTIELELADADDVMADPELVGLGEFELGAEPDDVLADLIRLRSS